jgi:hypothetical protein
MNVRTKKIILNFPRRLQTMNGMNGVDFMINTAKVYHSN